MLAIKHAWGVVFQNFREVHFSGTEHVRGNILGGEFRNETD